MAEACERFNYQTEDDLFASVGYGEVSPTTLANRLTEEERREKQIEKQKQQVQEMINQPAKKEPEKMKVRHEGGIVIEGVDNLLIRISRCCNPVPGDSIVGYITKGRGISIHRSDCPNVQNKDAANRLIDVEWEDATDINKEYDADLEIYGYDRSGLLNDVLQTVNTVTKRLVSVEAKTNKDKMATIRITVAIQNLTHLKSIVDKIKQIPDVYSVRRTKGWERMRAVIQRVSQASVSIEENIVGAIQQGFMVLLGITHEDTGDDVAYLVRKIKNLRVFEDEEGKMNRSLESINGAVLSISQFTLYGETKKGNRPSFIQAAPPSIAIPLYEAFNEGLQAEGITVATGKFGADMQVALVNDGPVTIVIDTKEK